MSSSKKSLSPKELYYCKKITDKIFNQPLSFPFQSPVDLKDYKEEINEPMDLSLIKEKIKNNKYESLEQWKYDMNLIWKNCEKFNGKDSFYTRMAYELKMIFDSYYSKIPSNDYEAFRFSVCKIASKISLILQYRPTSD